VTTPPDVARLVARVTQGNVDVAHLQVELVATRNILTDACALLRQAAAAITACELQEAGYDQTAARAVSEIGMFLDRVRGPWNP
jgi:hypothetical protein